MLHALLASVMLPVPADALAVVQVKPLGHVRTQLAGLAAAVAQERAEHFRRQLGELAFLDPTGRGFLAVLPDAGEVSWAAWLPSRDFARFVAAVGEPEFASRPLRLIDRTAAGFVIATPSARLAGRLASESKTLAVGGDAAGVFFASDVGVYVNLPAVQARWGGLLTGTRFALPTLLRSGAFGLPKFDPRQAAQIAAVGDGLIQTLADGSGLAVGVNLGPGGVTVDVTFDVRPNSPTAKLLAHEKPHPLPLLDVLPGGQPVYVAARFGAELARRFRSVAPEAAPLPAGHPGVHAADGWAVAGKIAGPMLEVSRPSDPPGWLQAVRTQFDRAEASQNLPLAGKPEWRKNAAAHRGRVFDRLTLRFDLSSATAAVPDEGVRQAAHAVIRGLAGDELVQWLGLDGDRGLRLSGCDWPAATRLLDAYLADGGKTCDDPAVCDIRRRLPAEASAVILLDAARFTLTVGELARGAVEALPAVPGLEVPALALPAGRPAYLGLAVTATPGGGRATLVLPAEALAACRATVR